MGLYMCPRRSCPYIFVFFLVPQNQYSAVLLLSTLLRSGTFNVIAACITMQKVLQASLSIFLQSHETKTEQKAGFISIILFPFTTNLPSTQPYTPSSLGACVSLEEQFPWYEGLWRRRTRNLVWVGRTYSKTELL